MSALTRTSGSPAQAASRTARGRFAALLAVFLLLFAGLAPAASAHDSIVSSDPRDGQNIAPGHREFVLTFSDKIQTFGADLILEDAQGKRTTLTPTIRDDQMRGAVTADLPVGSSTLRWRAVSSDGHPIDGIITFTVLDPSKPQSAASASSAPAPTPTPTSTSSSGASGAINVPLLLLGIVAALTGLFGGFIGMRLRKKDRP